MATIQRSGSGIQLTLGKGENEALISIIHLLSTKPDSPWKMPQTAYEDAKMQHEYEYWIVPTIEKTRSDDLATVVRCLSIKEASSFLSEDEVLSFVRVFNTLRHVAAATLGITDDDWVEHAEQTVGTEAEYKMLVVLGLLEEDFVSALESW